MKKVAQDQAKRPMGQNRGPRETAVCLSAWWRTGWHEEGKDRPLSKQCRAFTVRVEKLDFKV